MNYKRELKIRTGSTSTEIPCLGKKTDLSKNLKLCFSRFIKTHLPMMSCELALKSCFKLIVISFFGIFFVFESSIKYSGPPLFPSLEIIFDLLKI